MAHSVAKTYQEGPNSWKVVCTCGWKEGGKTEFQIMARFTEHRKRPHRV
jgi:hypothetical protein